MSIKRGTGACDSITHARTCLLWPVAAFGVGEVILNVEAYNMMEVIVIEPCP